MGVFGEGSGNSQVLKPFLGPPVAAIGFPDGNPIILGALFGLGKNHSTVDAYIR